MGGCGRPAWLARARNGCEVCGMRMCALSHVASDSMGSRNHILIRLLLWHSMMYTLVEWCDSELHDFARTRFAFSFPQFSHFIFGHCKSARTRGSWILVCVEGCHLILGRYTDHRCHSCRWLCPTSPHPDFTFQMTKNSQYSTATDRRSNWRTRSFWATLGNSSSCAWRNAD